MSSNLDDETASWIAAMTYSFATSLGHAIEGGRPDLIEGFLSGRYRLAVSVDEFVVLERSPDDVEPSW